MLNRVSTHFANVILQNAWLSFGIQLIVYKLVDIISVYIPWHEF